MSDRLQVVQDDLKKLAQLGPEAQFDALIASEHTGALVQQMAPQDLHAIAIAVGKEEAYELLPYCSGDQLVGLTDLSGWSAYRFDLVGYEDWLAAMLHAGDPTVGTYLARADVEQLLLYLSHRVQVHEADEEGDFPTLPNAVEGDALWTSPDRRFCMEIFDWDKAHDRWPEDPIKPLLKLMEGMDPFKLSRILAAQRWELKTPLEEDCLRLRNARMADLGFPPFEEAIGLYARGRVDHVLRQARRDLGELPSVQAPALTLRIRPRRDLLSSAIAQLDDAERNRLLAELAYTANQSMVACGIPVGDPDQVRQQWVALRATISLGLEFAARREAGESGDPIAAAASVVRQVHPRGLFRCGFNLCLPLHDLARRLRRDPRSGPGAKAEWLTPKTQRILEGLAQSRPVAADEQGDNPIETLLQLQGLATALHQALDIMAGIFDDAEQAKALLDIPVAGTNMAQHSDLDLIGLQRTSEAHELLGHGPLLAPLPAGALDTLRKCAPATHPVRQITGDQTDARFVAPLWVQLGA